AEAVAKASDEPSDEELEATIQAPSQAPAPARRSTPAPRGPDAAPPAIDFAAVYAQTTSAGDPSVDQMLTAFEAMKPAMPAAQLAVAISATAKALGADPAAIVGTLDRRLTALDTTLAEEQRKADEREAARGAELATLTQKVHMEIDAMEHKCAAFRQQLAAATERVHAKTASEHEVIAAFADRARGEADRLAALRDFLAPRGTRVTK
ncbi:MAG TPA: hypothetical protein VGC42_31700, partial [Kofleriaceae bacterium]